MFSIQQRDGNTVVFSGRLDASQADKALRVLDSVRGAVTLDFAGLDYISSAGIGAVVKTNVRLSKSGARIRVINAKPYVRSVFHYAGLDQLVEIE